jgi:hypothetical protein
MNGLLRVLVPRRPPLLTLLGVAIAIAGLGLDAAVHLTAAAHHHDAGFSVTEHGAHLVGLTGMVVALAGIVIHGVRRGLEHS